MTVDLATSHTPNQPHREPSVNSTRTACLATRTHGAPEQRLDLQAGEFIRDGHGGQAGGVVLNITSIGGFVGFQGEAYYHAGKFAVEGWTEAVAREMRAAWNIHFCLIEPGGVQTNFAAGSMVNGEKHPAYAAPDTPARVLEKFMAEPKNWETWALPDAVASAMHEIVARGQRIPIRVPLGPDAWGMLKVEVEQISKELDELKGLSEGVGNPKQFGTIDFLKGS